MRPKREHYTRTAAHTEIQEYETIQLLPLVSLRLSITHLINFLVMHLLDNFQKLCRKGICKNFVTNFKLLS